MAAQADGKAPRGYDATRAALYALLAQSDAAYDAMVAERDELLAERAQLVRDRYALVGILAARRDGRDVEDVIDDLIAEGREA